MSEAGRGIEARRRLLEVIAAQTDAIGRRAARDAGTGVELIGEYLSLILAAAENGKRFSAADLDAFRAQGADAAERGVALAVVLDLYLSATWRLWDAVNSEASGSSQVTIGSIASTMFRAADDAAEALAEGYAETQRRTVRFEESLRREFVDDLLAGTTAVQQLRERANRFGFNIAGTHHVVVAGGERPLVDAGPVHARVENQLLNSFGGRDVIVATKGGLLVCVIPGGSVDSQNQLVATLHGTGEGPWVIGVGRPDRGPTGVVRSYGEARAARELEIRLQRGVMVARYEKLLPFLVISTASDLAAEMVAEVLGPLDAARGGAAPLIETLRAHFESGGNVLATARSLLLSPRAVTYRLERVAQLTGHSVDHAESRFVLELAVRASVLVS